MDNKINTDDSSNGNGNGNGKDNVQDVCDDDDNNSIVTMRFSGMSLSTEQLLSDIIAFDATESESATTDTDNKKQHQHHRPSITLTKEDHCSSSSSANTNGGAVPHCNSNNNNSSSMLLTMRPSLMSLGTADKILEGFMAIAANDDDDDNCSYIDDNYNDNGNNNKFISVPTPTHSSTMLGGGGGGHVSRFSISADPLAFGAGGISIENEKGPDRKKATSSRQSMRFSISRGTLDMFDAPFDDEKNKSNNNRNVEVKEQQQESPTTSLPLKPVEVLSNEWRTTYLQETHDVTTNQEEALVTEMEQLSFFDQQKVIFDVHGIPQHTDHEPSHHTDALLLQKLDEELQKIVALYTNTNINNVAAFVEAQTMNPSYVNQNEFRMMFLRMYVRRGTGSAADDTNHELMKYYNETTAVKLAAAQMLTHFSVKKKIFGTSSGDNSDVLGKDVRLSDLSNDDCNAMDSGAWQTMPQRDMAGRLVILYAPSQRSYQHLSNWLRAMWYLLSEIAAHNDGGAGDSQRNGIVIVIHYRGYLPSSDRDSFELLQLVEQIKDAIPTRYAALHFCANDASTRMKALMTAHKVHFLTKDQRVHVREHLGTHEEICFQLETYGIPIDKTLFLPNGQLGMHWYYQWIHYRESIEEQHAVVPVVVESRQQQQQQDNTIATTEKKENNNPKVEDDEQQQDDTTVAAAAAAAAVAAGVSSSSLGGIILIPRKFDVLFGRGKNTREHVGNLRCACLVETYQQDYEVAKKGEKTNIATKIVNTVHDSGGRFLIKDKKKGWMEVEDIKAREKVAHFFRFFRRKAVTVVSPTKLAQDDNNSDTTAQENEKRSNPDLSPQQQNEEDERKYRKVSADNSYVVGDTGK